MRQYNAMPSPAWPKQLDVILVALHSLPRGTWSALTDPPPSRASICGRYDPRLRRPEPLELLPFIGLTNNPLVEYKDLEPDDISGTASSSLPRVHIKALTPHDAQIDVTPVTESPMTPALRSILRTKPPEFLGRLELMRIFSSASGTLNAPGWGLALSMLSPRCCMVRSWLGAVFLAARSSSRHACVFSTSHAQCEIHNAAAHMLCASLLCCCCVPR